MAIMTRARAPTMTDVRVPVYDFVATEEELRADADLRVAVFKSLTEENTINSSKPVDNGDIFASIESGDAVYTDVSGRTMFFLVANDNVKDPKDVKYGVAEVYGTTGKGNILLRNNDTGIVYSAPMEAVRLMSY